MQLICKCSLPFITIVSFFDLFVVDYMLFLQ